MNKATASGFATVGAEGATPVVTTRQGAVRGVVENGVAVFRGIPYAESPVGRRRFKPPVRVARWEGVRDARRFGDICPQTDESPIDSASLPRGVPQGDDCLNLNRWGIKPEVGVSHQVGPWTLEGYAGVWWFSTNSAYYPGGARKQQDPVFTWQTHVSRALPRRTWIAFNGTWFAGGTRVERVLNPDEQRNSRLGATFSLPIAPRQSLKFVYSTGATTRRGSDFNTFNVTWQLVTF